MYRTAEAIMEYAYYNSERFNNKTAINRKELNERMMKYHEDYTTQLKSVVQNMVTPNDGICYSCKPRTKSIVTLP
jgi:hypothetical protein